MVESLNDKRENDEIEEFEGELEELKNEFFSIKKESFMANSGLKDEIKRLGFYNGDETGEEIKFNISNIRKHLETIKNKTWSELDVKSSVLEKGVRTIAIQIAINYINMKNGGTTSNIDLIDGVRGNQTWRGVKEFQTKYELKNKDGLPGHETIIKILELLPNDKGESNHSIYNGEQETSKIDGHGHERGEIEEFVGNKNFLDSRLNHNDVDNNKCLNLFKNFKIGSVNNVGHGIQSKHWHDFENKLKERFIDEGGLESIILQNPEIGNLLWTIANHQSKEIENRKSRHIKNVGEWNITKEETEKSSNESIEDKVESLNQYKFKNGSLESFENFIISDEGIAIIIDEIKSHVDTSHENQNGEYDKFYEKYPFSVINLEVRLKNAREDKMRSNYYAENYDANKEQMEKLDDKSNVIIRYVDKIVGDYKKSGKDNFNGDIIASLESFLSNGIEIEGTYYGGETIFDNNQDYLDIFQGILSSKIKNYESFVRNSNDEFILDTGDKQVDLQLKSYLYLYGRIFYAEHFKASKEPKYYEDILPEVMKIIISDDDKSLINKIKNKEFLEAEKKLKKERDERDLRRRQDAAKINRERNERLQSMQRIDKKDSISKIETNYVDPNQATGTELAAEANLGKDLEDYSLDIEESDGRQQLRKEAAFREAWKDFIQYNDNIKSLITQEEMRRLFDINSGNIRNFEWENFKESNPLLKDIPSDEIEKIRIVLSGFSSYFNEAEKKLSNNSSEMKEKVDETIKTYAIGAVIDNVRDTFETITEGQGEAEGFKLNKENPIKKEGDDIIIFGSFNGSDVKVRYNLKTGELFMNTFLHRLSQTKISIGENDSIDYRIGAIKPFNDVLNDYYKFSPQTSNNSETSSGPIYGNRPQKSSFDQHQRLSQEEMEQRKNLPGDRPAHPIPRGMPVGPQVPKIDESNINTRKEEAEKILNSQIALIGKTIKDNTESQTQKNSSINKFLKTFNIISDTGGFKSVDFNKGSNLFDVIEIIENTADVKNGDIQSLEYFNNIFMPKVMEYSGLRRGERNDYQDKQNEKSKKLFNYKGDNENINSFKNSVDNFNPSQFSGVANFESQHQLGFADFIKEKLITGSELNLRLDILKMESFIKDLETEEKDADTELEKQLSYI